MVKIILRSPVEGLLDPPKKKAGRLLQTPGPEITLERSLSRDLNYALTDPDSFQTFPRERRDEIKRLYRVKLEFDCTVLFVLAADLSEGRLPRMDTAPMMATAISEAQPYSMAVAPD